MRVVDQAQFSPDGKWLAYASNESGRNEVYVIPFREAGVSVRGKWQVSTSGGSHPHWRQDGKELFYLRGDCVVVSTEVALNADFSIGKATPLFTRHCDDSNLPYNVSPDGSRFLVSEDPEQRTGLITLVQNWPSDLER
jgi:eukaryotic-like serine/threonine-protein kinase